MVCSDSPPLLVSDGEISFQGFGNSKESLDDPYFDLQGLRVGEKEKYIREQISVIKRDDIYESMINLYKKRNVKNSKISLRFEGEDAVGDGVTRDAFSAFIRSVYNKFDGEFQRIPSNLNNVEELKLIGEIFTHGFIVSNVFPLQICKASLKYYLFESCTDEELFPVSYTHLTLPTILLV